MDNISTTVSEYDASYAKNIVSLIELNTVISTVVEATLASIELVDTDSDGIPDFVGDGNELDD